MSRKTVSRVKLIKDKQELCILQLIKTGDEYSLSLSETDKEIKELIEDIAQRLKQHKQYEEKLEFWTDLLLELEKESIDAMELPKHDREFSLQFDMDSGEMAAIQKDALTGQQVSDDIGRNIANILSKVFSEFGVDYVTKIEAALSKKDWIEAFSILEKGINEGMIRLASKETKAKLLHSLQLLPPSSLDPDKRKKFYEIKFGLGEETRLFNLLFEDASQYIE